MQLMAAPRTWIRLDIPFINLDSDYHNMDLARHSAKQQHLMDNLIAFVVDGENAEQARASQHAEELQTALTQSLTDQEVQSKGKGNTPMEVEGKGKVSMEV